MFGKGVAVIVAIVAIVTIGSGENAAEMHSDLLHECLLSESMSLRLGNVSELTPLSLL